MKADQVTKALRQKFLDEGERLVFWRDGKGDFEAFVRAGLGEGLEAVEVLEVAALGGLSTKLKIERESTDQKFLIYSQGEAPDPGADWLLDIRLYSAVFEAEMSSLWRQELGLETKAIRSHLEAREAFLGSKDRRGKLRGLVEPQDSPVDLDRKMIAVLVGAQTANAPGILRAMGVDHATGGTFELGTEPEVMSRMEKMGLLAPFWQMMDEEFGFRAEAPLFSGLMRGLFLTDLLVSLPEGARLPSLEHLRLPSTRKANNAVIFLTHWRDSSSAGASYDAAAAAIAKEQGIKGKLQDLGLEGVREVYTFWDAELATAKLLKDRVVAEREELDLDWMQDLVKQRMSHHWLSTATAKRPERQALAEAYRAIEAAARLFCEVHEFGRSFDPADPEELLTQYATSTFRVDQLYREFCTQAQGATAQGWDLLKGLTEDVERCYDDGFLVPLGVRWSEMLDAGFLEKWELDSLPAQQAFFARKPAKRIAEGDRQKAFVIISDALRFEVAEELTRRLNGQDFREAELAPMLGVLPSYTALGMASLLPHRELSYSDKGDVLVDGKSTAGTKARDKVLSAHQGMACQATDLLPMTTSDARELVAGKRVVYIYHNVIDARGDSSSTEEGTFAAVRECLEQLESLVQICFSKLNASKVWVTADHGFLFQQSPPSEADRTSLVEKPEGAFTSKKRYVIGRNLGDAPQAHRGTISRTAGDTSGMEFWVPRASNRFHFTGGARFVHGGAMPQEVVVPLVTATSLRKAADREASRSDKVGVQILGNAHRITTPRYRFEFIQTDAVSERCLALTVRAAVYRGAEPVTNLKPVVFDSTSGQVDDRKKAIMLDLLSGTFDKHEDYRLILRDAETGAEVLSVPVIIDRSFEDEF